MSEHPNRLITQKSPYLLQHAHNPVDWYPWGDEPFARAREEGKPVFLSIGYSTCHWCHVMAHESFENQEVAELLNRWFISIKVDREERPDIDQMYMAATHVMEGSGGWPMSVFLLPDGSPFYAGTYFPLRSSRQRPGFIDLLTALHDAWQERREEIERAAKAVVDHLRLEESGSAAMPDDAPNRCFAGLASTYDATEGGFGEAPKFPRPATFAFLFEWYRKTRLPEAKTIALHTLRKMADGGICDHLGGGFHRYSVDAHWLVPHFEKMLYDQGQLAQAYLDAFVLSGEALFARVAGEIFTYMLRDMQHPDGGFYSAEDADSVNPYAPAQHGEGAYYLWTEADLRNRLAPDTAELFCFVYGIRKKGNVDDDPLGEFTGRNILHRARTTAAAAERFTLAEEEIEKRLDTARQTLLLARQTRTRPHLDDKIVTGWNGLLLGALARGSRILQDPALLTAALRAADFIERTLYKPAERTLLRRYRDGEAALAGQSDDYGYLVSGLLDLYQASHEPHWLQWAETLTERQIELFWNEAGGYFYDSAEDPSLKVRMRGIYDGAEPTGNSVAAHNLLRLSVLRDRDDWRHLALRLMASFAETIDHYPPAMPLLLTAWLQGEASHRQIVIAGARDSTDTAALLAIAEPPYHPHQPVLLADGGANQRFLAQRLPFLRNVSARDGRATAYVCRDFSCSAPTSDPEQLRRLLSEA